MSYVEFLAAHHDRKSFDCGKEPLNRFIRTQAQQNADRDLGVTHVVVTEVGDAQILGYFTLVTRQIESASLPRPNKLPAGPIGVALLGRLAVDLRSQKQRLGVRMLLRAMSEVEHIARTIGIHALVLDVLDELARIWYLGLDLGFRPLPEQTDRLFVPVSYIRQLELGPLTPEL